ncbi:V-type proton ATPase subunit d 1 [Acropora cervicornis]|uniref:V-type proton ATPase subunit d 1 n=1 Tax=Acropora cervicornis TaxID=6130 RepID=A0AAD9QDZ1_ACRCE|nr:V-type proton ATPase subunit d 1 [Acropora cervicornis]
MAETTQLMSFQELLFNVDTGYLEALVRGFRSGILTQSDYLNLSQCETLEDLKLHLQSTDYGNFLQNEAGPLNVSVIDDRLREKLVTDYSYMIDNIILLITGTLHQRPITELVPKCHPLGSFEEMASINIASTPADLYNAVMIDTPLAPFFVECISEQDLDEMNIEIIRNTLYKNALKAKWLTEANTVVIVHDSLTLLFMIGEAYLEGFYKFCEDLGGTTADVMCPILQFEADRRAFIITINSFGTELGKDDRNKLYPKCGKLYPEGLSRLAKADDYEQVRAVAEYYSVRKLQYHCKYILLSC